MPSDSTYISIGTTAPDSGERVLLRDLKAPIAQRNRETLYQAITTNSASECGREEIESHFANMPQRYWLRANEAACRWHLSTVHRFFERVALAHTVTTSPVVQWRVLEEKEVIEVAICSWDRPGLLMNIAGALSRAGFDILLADVYTRTDHIALDIFQVREADGSKGLHEMRLRYATRLLAAAMAVPQSFSLPVPSSSDDDLVQKSPSRAPVVAVDTEFAAEYTVLRVDAEDHIGLLFRLLEALVSSSVCVEQATILTLEGRARDVFCVTDAEGRKIEDEERLSAIHQRMLRAIGASYNFVPNIWGADPLHLVEQEDEMEL